jgi:hypothetical protein
MMELTRPVPGEAVESVIARDMARRAALAAPVVVVGLGLARGGGAAAGAALALAVVAANFLAAAAILAWAARISPGALATAALGGYVVRLAVVTVAGLAVRTQGWVDFTVFCIVLVVSHLGLLFWELRSVSLSLAAPGLHPPRSASLSTSDEPGGAS